jgi:FkbM family methyltransferase
MKWRLVKKLLVTLLPSRLLLNLKKQYYTHSVKTFWERDIEPIKFLVKPGDVVMDIGANVGWYTRILGLLVGEHGKVYSLEPIPETFELLSSVIRNLRLPNVELMNCAISETDGSAVMEIPLHENSGIENHYLARLCVGERSPNPFPKHEVTLRTLDSVFSELPHKIAFIKCDVEGHELSVIRGASHLIAKAKPAWLLEISGNPDDEDSTAGRVFLFLDTFGYTPYWFDGRKLRKRAASDVSTNYFFLQHSHVDQLGVLII